MRAPRRDTHRNTPDSEVRIWQLYADEIGIPGAQGSESLARHTDVPTARRRRLHRMPKSAGGLLGTIAAVVIAVTAGSVLWSRSPISLGTVPRDASMTPSRPVGEAARHTDRTARTTAAGEERRALPATPAPKDTVVSSREVDAVVSPAANTPSAPSVTHSADATSRTTPSPGPKRERGSFMHRIVFDFGSDRINEASKPELDLIIATMKANPEWRMAIEGHTDAQGTPDYNQVLSERRAHAVKGHLESAGIAPGRLSAFGFGASRPAAPRSGPREFLNRRVEVHRR